MLTINSFSYFLVYKAPKVLDKKVRVTVFLAGSIKIGKATKQQIAFTLALLDLLVTVFNLRCNNQNLTQKQDILHLKFNKQVIQKYNCLNKVNVIAIYFKPSTLSSISLLELGKYTKSRKIVVYCLDRFQKRGNIQIEYYQKRVLLVETIEKLRDYTRERLEKAIKNLALLGV